MSKRGRIVHSVDKLVIKENIKNLPGGIGENKNRYKFALRLNTLLEEKDIHQTEFYKKIGISSGALSNYRTGKSEPGLTTLVKLAKELNISVEYISGISDIQDSYSPISINDKLGLSDSSIRVLEQYKSKDSDTELSVINFLLEQEELTLAQQQLAHQESLLDTTKLAQQKFTHEELINGKLKLTGHDLENIIDKELEKQVQFKNKIERKKFIPIISTISDYFLTKDKKDKKISMVSNLIPFNDKLYDFSKFIENQGNFTNEGVSYNEIVDFTYFRKIENKLKEAKEKYMSDFQKESDNQ